LNPPSQIINQAKLMQHPEEENPPPRSFWTRLGLAFGGLRNRGELEALLGEARERGLIDPSSFGMLEGVLELGELRVSDVMIPRGQMVALRVDDTLEEVMHQLIDSGHSRFPVFDEEQGEVVGVLLAKDLLRYFRQPDGDGFTLARFLRAPFFIPESKRLEGLLTEFRVSRQHMAIVIDEYGGVAGLITIEDVLEQVVGEIADEYDEAEEALFIRHAPDRFTVKAMMPIEEFNEALTLGGTARLSDEEFDTIGGLVTHAFGHVPARGERIELGNLEFRVLATDRRRILSLKVHRLSTATSAS